MPRLRQYEGRRDRYKNLTIVMGYYINADYYIFNDKEKIYYIGTLEDVLVEPKTEGPDIIIKRFNNIRDEHTREKIKSGKHVINGIFDYVNSDSDWRIQLVEDTPAYEHSMGIGGKTKHRKTRSRKVKKSKRKRT